MTTPSPASKFIDQATDTLDLGDGLVWEFRAVGKADIPQSRWVLFNLGLLRYMVDKNGEPREERFRDFVESQREARETVEDESADVDLELVCAGGVSPRVLNHKGEIPDPLPENTITTAHLRQDQIDRMARAVLFKSLGLTDPEAREVAEEAATFREGADVPPDNGGHEANGREPERRAIPPVTRAGAVGGGRAFRGH